MTAFNELRVARGYVTMGPTVLRLDAIDWISYDAGERANSFLLSINLRGGAVTHIKFTSRADRERARGAIERALRAPSSSEMLAHAAAGALTIVLATALLRG